MKMLLSDGTFQTEGDGRGRWMRGWRAWRDDAGVGRLDEASSSSTLARSALACVIGCLWFRPTETDHTQPP